MGCLKACLPKNLSEAVSNLPAWAHATLLRLYKGLDLAEKGARRPCARCAVKAAALLGLNHPGTAHNPDMQDSAGSTVQAEEACITK